MPSTAHRAGIFRVSARIVVFGLWTVLFGLLILLFAIHLFGTVASFSGTGLGQSLGFSLETVLFDSMLFLYLGGFLSLVTGAFLMAVGGVFIVGASR